MFSALISGWSVCVLWVVIWEGIIEMISWEKDTMIPKTECLGAGDVAKIKLSVLI